MLRDIAAAQAERQHEAQRRALVVELERVIAHLKQVREHVERKRDAARRRRRW